MFDFLRKGATSFLAKIFLAVIIIVFVFWGVGIFTSGRKDIIAKVNGAPITLKEFQEYYNFQLFKLKQTFGDLTSEDLKKLNLKQQVLSDLIRIKLLEKEAENLGINITPEEINYAIAQIPFFQENGVFSPQKYQFILRRLGISSNFFKFLVKADLIYQRLKLIVTAPIIVSDDEVKDYINYNKQKLILWEGWLPLNYCESKISYTEKDLENYYLAHRDVYKEPEKVKLYYLFVPYKDKEKVKVSEEEIKKFYLENLNRFKQPFRVKLRSIFIQGTDEEAFKKAEKIRSKLKSISDFNKYDSKKGQWFEETALPQNIRNLIKQAKKGKIIGPLKVSSGYLILGVEEVQPERVLTLKEVKKEIVNFLKNEKIRNQAKEKADRIYTEVIKENGLKFWAKKHKIKLKETAWLTQKELTEKVQDYKLAKEILKGNKGEYFAPIETSKGILIVEIADKKPARVLPFKEVKEKVKKDYLYFKGKEFCENKAEKFLSRIKNKEKLKKEDILKAGFKFKEIKVKRYELSKYFNFDIALALTKVGKPKLLEKLFWDQEGLKIFYVKKIEPFNGTISKQELLQVSSILLRNKREKWFNKWYQLLREQAKIKIYPIFENI